MSNQLQLAGAQETRPVHFAPISTNRFFQGLWTQRNPLRDGGSTRIEEKFYGSRGDAMIDGSNIEISNRLTPVRRPGLSVYNSQHFTAIDYFYEFRQFTTTSETIKVMVDTAAALYDGTGPSTKNLVWTKSSGAGQTYMQDVANTLYFGNGVDQKKWMQPAGWTPSTSFAIGNSIIDSNGNLQYLVQATVGTVSNVSLTGKVAAITFLSGGFAVTPLMSFTITGLGGASFLNNQPLIARTVVGNVVTAYFDHIDYISAPDSGTATTLDVGTPVTSGVITPVWNVVLGGITLDGSGTFQWQNYGSPTVFDWTAAAPTLAPTFPSPSIGDEGFWQALTQYPSLIAIVDSQGFIQHSIVNGLTGNRIPAFIHPTALNEVMVTADGTQQWICNPWLGTFAGTSSSWQASTPTSSAGSAIVDTNGNLQIVTNGPGGNTGGVAPTWNTAVSGTTADGGLTWTNFGAYSGLAFQGWMYGYAFHSIDGSVSTLSPLSPLTNGVISQVTLSVSTSSDPQVDSIWIFRTTDGGSTPLFLASVPNAFPSLVTGYTDNSPDSVLNFEIIGPQAKENDPPPAGFINLTYHLGRIFGSVQNVVSWSAGPDISAGNGNTAFPPLNFATFPSRVTRIVPTSSGAFVFTISDIYLIVGLGTSSSPLFSTPYASGIGLLSYNALAVNGTLVYLFTSDSQLIALDPSSGISQVGFPIGDQFQLSNWNPLTTYVTWHVSGSQDHALYVADGSTGWFRMTPTASPEAGLTWSPFATITGGAKAVQSIEVSPGIHRLLVGPVTSGAILQRDLSVFQDNGTSYSAFFTVGSLVLALPGQIAELSFITTDAKLVGSSPTPSVLLDEISGVFDFLPIFTQDPPQLPKSATTYNQRFYFSQTGSPAICRHLQVKLSWPAENFQNELYSMTIFGGFMQED